MNRLFIKAMAISLLAINTTEACSLFWMKHDNATVIGHNFDWYQAGATYVVNKRNVQKDGLLSALDPTPRKQWVSRYGSLTVNQHGIGNPVFGINEHKLYAGVAWLNDSTYIDNKQTAINEAQLTQYILDLAQNVQEAVNLLDTVQVRSLLAPVHYLVCDPQECAIFEFFDNKLTIKRHPGESLVGITNDSLGETEKAKTAADFFNPQEAVFKDSSSTTRYQVGYAKGTKLQAQHSSSLEEDMSTLLQALAHGYKFLPTTDENGNPQSSYVNVWQGIVNPQAISIMLKTSLEQFKPGIAISLNMFNLDCDGTTTYEVADVVKANNLGKAAFVTSADDSIDQIFASAYDLPFRKTEKGNAAMDYLTAIAREYPKSFVCKQ